MKRLFLSADIEGTCGIVDWDETQKGHADYLWFADQMTREVAAACEGAGESGYGYVLVKDAHDSARNLNPRALPPFAQVLRGWAGHPYSMMMGLDRSFDGVVFTGYHSAAGREGNPLSHTMTTSLFSLSINGEPASELYINSLIAAYEGVPVYALSGDKGLCDWMQARSPHTRVVATNEGVGGATRSLHPDVAVQLLREAVREAVLQPREDCLFPLPSSFQIEVCYREHQRAYSRSFYPGLRCVDARTLRFEHSDFFEVLRMMHFCL
ncbi:MAG: M55 family metallopeptidase [Christensenellales bacterium]